jgi:hypothetical protein
MQYKNMFKPEEFWNITPCSQVKANRRFSGTYHLHLQDLFVACVMLVSYVAYYLILKMKTKCLSETSINFHRTTLRYIPEDKAFHSHRCENLASSMFKVSIRMKYSAQKLLFLFCIG